MIKERYVSYIKGLSSGDAFDAVVPSVEGHELRKYDSLHPDDALIFSSHLQTLKGNALLRAIADLRELNTIIAKERDKEPENYEVLQGFFKNLSFIIDGINIGRRSASVELE